MPRPKLTRPTTDLFERDGSVLDVNMLHRNGAFAQPMFYPLRRMKTFPDHIEIRFPLPNKPPEIFLIERTRLHLGGHRPWFVCHCGRRCGKLFLTSIHASCRLCAELGFKSQRQDRPQRLAAKAEAIRNRLDADAFGNPKRPRKMFERTFRRYLHTLTIIQHAIATRSGIASVRYRRHRERDSAGRYCAG